MLTSASGENSCILNTMMQFHLLTASESQTQNHGCYYRWDFRDFLFVFPYLLINAFLQLNIQDFSILVLELLILASWFPWSQHQKKNIWMNTPHWSLKLWDGWLWAGQCPFTALFFSRIAFPFFSRIAFSII